MSMSMYVVKRNGQKENVSFDKVSVGVRPRCDSAPEIPAFGLKMMPSSRWEFCLLIQKSCSHQWSTFVDLRDD